MSIRVSVFLSIVLVVLCIMFGLITEIKVYLPIFGIYYELKGIIFNPRSAALFSILGGHPGINLAVRFDSNVLLYFLKTQDISEY